MGLQLKRGVGAPTVVLDAGEPYFDTTNNIMWLGNGAVNTPYIGESGYSISSEVATIPAISADTRSVLEIVISKTLINPRRVLIGFFTDSAIDAEIQLRKVVFMGAYFLKDGLSLYAGGNEWIPQILRNTSKYTLTDTIKPRFLNVTEDYTKGEKFVTNDVSVGKMKYGAGAGTDLPSGFTYADIGVGVLSGWYGIPGTGFLTVDKKIELESAWIETVASVTTLSLALYNRDVAPNTPKGFTIGIYE